MGRHLNLDMEPAAGDHDDIGRGDGTRAAYLRRPVDRAIAAGHVPDARREAGECRGALRAPSGTMSEPVPMLSPSGSISV
jgi:hypothetical protein